MAMPLRIAVRSYLRPSFCVSTQIRQISIDDFKKDGKESQGKKGKAHPETPQFPNEYSTDLPKGKIFDKKPFKVELQAGKAYSWCACGTSKNQPFCDGSHKKLWGTSEKKTMPKWMSHKFKVEETKEYWLCMCKQTDKRPFCDGTHKKPDIQAAVK